MKPTAVSDRANIRIATMVLAMAKDIDRVEGDGAHPPHRPTSAW